jgi:hypothetical protein
MIPLQRIPGDVAPEGNDLLRVGQVLTSTEIMYDKQLISLHYDVEIPYSYG